MDLNLRRLQPTDAPAYRALMLQAYARHPEAFSSSVAEREVLPLAWWEARLRPDPAPGQPADARVLGAWQGPNLVGAVGLSVEGGERQRHQVLLFGMVVAPGQRQQGLGARLLDAAVQAARDWPECRLLRLTVSASNAAARRLYERAGFVAWGVEPMAVALGSGFVDKLHMRCLLLPEGPRSAWRWWLADSECLACEATSWGWRLRFSAARVDRCEPDGWVWVAGYVRPLNLCLVEPQLLSGEHPGPGRLRDGRLWLGQAQPATQLPLPWQWAQPLRLELAAAGPWGGESLIQAQGAWVESPPGAQFEESLAC